MKKLTCVLSALALACVLALPSLAQTSPAAGEWAVALSTPGGVRNFTVALKIDGEKLSGEIKENKTPLTGTAKGNDVQIIYSVKYNDNDLQITMTGKIAGDAIKGTASFGGFAEDEWSAKRAGGTSASAASSSGGKVDVSGAWNVEVATEAGSGSPSITLKQEGEKLTGKYKGQLGESDLTGTVKGDKIEFSFKVSGQVEGTVVYSGTTDGKTMSGKVSLAGLGEGTFKGKKQ